jgi:hypothetical protein
VYAQNLLCLLLLYSHDDLNVYSVVAPDSERTPPGARVEWRTSKFSGFSEADAMADAQQPTQALSDAQVAKEEEEDSGDEVDGNQTPADGAKMTVRRFLFFGATSTWRPDLTVMFFELPGIPEEES